MALLKNQSISQSDFGNLLKAYSTSSEELPITPSQIGAATPEDVESAIVSHLAVQNPHEITAAMIDAFVRTGTNSISLGDSFKIAWGITSISIWRDYNSIGIVGDVDTHQGAFTKTPIYFTSLIGNSHWRITGITAVYASSPASFRVYLRDSMGEPGITPSFATSQGWRIAWLGIQSE